MKLRIYPYEQNLLNKSTLSTAGELHEAHKFMKPVYHYSSGKDAIRRILNFEKLNRNDEVFISTTSDSDFVSSCVTSTVFNFAKLSRVLTDQTKLIFVIHEFGFPNTHVEELALYAKNANIKLVEDAAHSFDTYHNGKPLGSWGDYVIHSTPKTLPVQTGGCLLTDIISNEFQEENHKSKEEFKNFSGLINYFTQKRILQYQYYVNEFAEYEQIYRLTEGVNPFAFGLKSKKYKEIYSVFENALDIELLRTYNKDWVVIPLNPIFKQEQIEFIANSLKGILNK